MSSGRLRNGRLQACDPCHRRKLKCDHVTPVCSRCIRTKRESQCVYNLAIPAKRSHESTISPKPASSSRSAGTPRSIDQATPLKPDRTADDIRTQSIQPSPREAIARPPVQVARTASTIDGASTYMQTPPLSGNAGYLGATSFQSVFENDLPKLGITFDQGQCRITEETQLSEERIGAGAKILQLIGDRNLVERFLRYDYNWDLISPLCRIWWKHLWDDYDQVFKDGSREAIEPLVKTTFQNMKHIDCSDAITMHDYGALTSGTNVRWETIGLIIAEIGIRARSLAPSDPIFFERGARIDRSAFAARCLESVELCVTFSKSCEHWNELTLWLLLRSNSLCSAMLGHTAPLAYLRLGTAVTAAVTLGVHELRETHGPPRLLTELRKHALIEILHRESKVATFLGRPPRLYYKHCSMPIPVDIPTWIWLNSDNDIQHAVSNLKDGWNPHGALLYASWLRKSVLNSMRRQDIMDLALTNSSKEQIVQQADQIKAHMAKDFESLPPFMQEPEISIPQPSDSPLIQLMRKTGTFASVGNELLLQRTLVQKAGLDSVSLIAPALKVFEQILELGTSNGLMHNLQIELSWLMLAYGVRTSAILALELIKQETRTSTEPELLPRSKTIQDLSVFTSCLERLDRSDGNWQACQQAARTLKRLLDRILSPPRHSSATVSAPPQEVSSSPKTPDPMAGIDGFNWTFDTSDNLLNDVEFVNWLDHLDFEQTIPS